MFQKTVYIMHDAFLTLMIQGFLYFYFSPRHIKKSLLREKAQCVCSGRWHAALTMADTPSWFDFPGDIKAIISHDTSLQLFPSSIYWVQTGFRSSTWIPALRKSKTMALKWPSTCSVSQISLLAASGLWLTWWGRKLLWWKREGGGGVLIIYDKMCD